VETTETGTCPRPYLDRALRGWGEAAFGCPSSSSVAVVAAVAAAVVAAVVGYRYASTSGSILIFNTMRESKVRDSTSVCHCGRPKRTKGSRSHSTPRITTHNHSNRQKSNAKSLIQTCQLFDLSILCAKRYPKNTHKRDELLSLSFHGSSLVQWEPACPF
jgi:hypothetical protein